MERASDAAKTYDAGAAAYDRFMGRWSRLFIPALLEEARVGPGQRVLDVATGTGEAALSAASIVRPSGWVVGVDISLPMLDAARPRVAGRPIELVACDATRLPFPDGTFDTVICQLGLMLIPDQAQAAREFRRVLRVGGRVAACVWSSPERAPILGLLADALARALPADRDILYLGYSLSDPDVLGALLADAGFEDITVRRESRELVFDSFEDYWEPIEAGGARLGQAYRGLGETARRDVLEEVRARAARFGSRGRLVMPAETLLAAARR